MKSIFSVLFILFCFGLNAQNTASIEDFSIDGVIHYKVKYTGNTYALQIDELNDGKWHTVYAVANEALVDTDPANYKEIQNQFATLVSGRKYKLKITSPAIVESKELQFDK